MTKDIGHRTTGWKAGRWICGAAALAAALCIAVVSQAQQQETATDENPLQDDLFAPSPSAQSEQLDQNAAQQDSEQSQPPTGLQDQTSAQPGALDQPSGLEDQPMPPPSDRQRGMRQDMQHGMRGEMRGDQQRMGQAGGRGELGVFLISSEDRGAEIRGVVTGSAADEAGLETGDVILAINGEEIRSPNDVSQAIREIGAGQQARLQVWRDGQESELAATLQPARDRYAVGFRGESSMDVGSGNIEERQQRIEQQLDRVMDELAQLRQEMRQMRGSGASAMPSTSFEQETAPPSRLRSTTPDALDEPTGVNEPPGFEGAGASRPGTSGTVSGAAGTTPVEAGSAAGPGIPPASTP